MMGEAEPTTHLVCGYLGCDARPFNPLLAALPRVLHVASRDDDALRSLIALALGEARERRIGGETVLERLSELLFVDVIRRYIAAQPAEQTGWLAGLRDPIVGAALAALHAEPARAWDLELLAHATGSSRSVLAERFTELVGRPPMQYLTRWRMQLAAARLRSATDTIAAVAEHVGYTSEAAFSRAFKRETGVAPAAWRRALRAGAI
jgi:AraC-like DNA-binding protein